MNKNLIQLGLVGIMYFMTVSGQAFASCESEVQEACRKMTAAYGAGSNSCGWESLEQALELSQKFIRKYTTESTLSPNDPSFKEFLNSFNQVNPEVGPHVYEQVNCEYAAIRAYWASRKSGNSNASLGNGNVSVSKNSNSTEKSSSNSAPKKQRGKNGVEFTILEPVWSKSGGFPRSTFNVPVTNNSPFTITCRVKASGTDVSLNKPMTDQSTIMISPGVTKSTAEFDFFDPSHKVRTSATCEKSPLQ